MTKMVTARRIILTTFRASSTQVMRMLIGEDVVSRCVDVCGSVTQQRERRFYCVWIIATHGIISVWFDCVGQYIVNHTVTQSPRSYSRQMLEQMASDEKIVLHRVSKKVAHRTLQNIFAQGWPIAKISMATESQIISEHNCVINVLIFNVPKCCHLAN